MTSPFGLKHISNKSVIKYSRIHCFPDPNINDCGYAKYTLKPDGTKQVEMWPNKSPYPSPPRPKPDNEVEYKYYLVFLLMYCLLILILMFLIQFQSFEFSNEDAMMTLAILESIIGLVLLMILKL